MSRVSRSMWLTIVMRTQGGRCFHCEIQMGELPSPRPHRHQLADDHPTVEHVHPASSSGKHLINNTVIACHACNRDRGNTPPTDEMIAKATVIYGLLGLVPFVHSRLMKTEAAKQYRVASALLEKEMAK